MHLESPASGSSKTETSGPFLTDCRPSSRRWRVASRTRGKRARSRQTRGSHRSRSHRRPLHPRPSTRTRTPTTRSGTSSWRPGSNCSRLALRLESAFRSKPTSRLHAEAEKRWGTADACADARPTLTAASELPREVYAPEKLLSCTNRGGACAPLAAVAALELKRQEACAWTGTDPMRFGDIGRGTPMAGEDRIGQALAQRATWLEIVSAAADSPLASVVATYSIAHGERPDTTAARVELAEGVAGMAANIASARSAARPTSEAQASTLVRADNRSPEAQRAEPTATTPPLPSATAACDHDGHSAPVFR